VLDPVDRTSEIVFGVLMAMSVTGSLSVAQANRGDVVDMLYAALGCNLAWGLTDAVMYLVAAKTERYRKAVLMRRLRAARDDGEAHRLLAAALPDRVAAGASPQVLEALRERLVAAPIPGTRFAAAEYVGALTVFALVVLSTFPIVVPFLAIGDARLALRVSNLLGLATLFIGGYFLGRYAGSSPWKFGAGMGAVGVVLLGVILALGG
jgi:hypothetical protein